MLRASAEAKNIPVNLAAVTDSSLDSGVEHGDVLLRFADAVCGADNSVMGPARTALLDRTGPAALVETAAIAANFSTNDRVSNAFGIHWRACSWLVVKPTAKNSVLTTIHRREIRLIANRSICASTPSYDYNNRF